MKSKNELVGRRAFIGQASLALGSAALNQTTPTPPASIDCEKPGRKDYYQILCGILDEPWEDGKRQPVKSYCEAWVKVHAMARHLADELGLRFTWREDDRMPGAMVCTAYLDGEAEYSLINCYPYNLAYETWYEAELSHRLADRYTMTETYGEDSAGVRASWIDWDDIWAE